TLPAASVAVALICVTPSAGSSAWEKLTSQLPASSIVAGFVVSPQVTWTVLPGSAVPATRTPAAASPASTTSSAATAPIIGASGGVVSAGVPAVSTTTSTLVGALSPAALDAVAVIVVAPSSGTSSMGKLTDHTPFSSVVAVWVKDSPSAPLQTTVMVLPGWAVP